MFLKPPKNTDRFLWTNHSFGKMRFYRISESRVKRIIKNPQRIEEGIAPETIAVMQRNDRKNKKEEIWVMYQIKTKNEKLKIKSKKMKIKDIITIPKIKIISVWRYPGVSPIRESPPIPEDILEELKREYKFKLT